MFYDKFTKLCTAKGVTAAEFSKDTGVAQSTISMWRKDGAVPSSENLVKVANYFDVSVNYLLAGEESEQQKSPTSDEIGFDDFTYAFANETKDLTEEDKQKLLEMARIFKEHQEKKEKGK